MSFKERGTATTKVQVVQEFAPYVRIASEALDKMKLYVDECPDEIGWLGTAYRDEREIYLEDVYLFEQEVHATTTEITPEGLSSFAEQLLMEENGMEIWNNLKMWGHSHVNMGVSPSGQDDSQMETFKQGGHDWFIRLIANKKGELKVDLYDYKTGVVYLDLPWFEELPEDEANIQDAIEKLYEELDRLYVGRKDKHKEDIVAEMKEKVSKKTYVYSYASKKNTTIHKPTNRNTGQTSGTNSNTATIHTDMVGDDDETNLWMITVFETDDDVTDWFTKEELYELSFARTLTDADRILYSLGHDEYFSDDDLETIIRVANKINWKEADIYE